MEQAHYDLLLGRLDETKTAMTKCEGILDSFATVERGVHASFYRVSADFHKVRQISRAISFHDTESDRGRDVPCAPPLQAKAEYAEFYRDSLLYLACVDIDVDLTPSDCIARAHDLCIASLLGETIYSFGELVRPSSRICPLV